MEDLDCGEGDSLGEKSGGSSQRGAGISPEKVNLGRSSVQTTAVSASCGAIIKEFHETRQRTRLRTRTSSLIQEVYTFLLLSASLQDGGDHVFLFLVSDFNFG